MDNQRLVERILEDHSTQNDEDVIQLILQKKISHKGDAYKTSLTFGQRTSDRLATMAGSWMFIISFMALLVVWILINVFEKSPFDPYPFILLNLILSCIAAIQAPIIMMSQNRKEHKDRVRAENNYRVDLKSEILIEEMFSAIKELKRGQSAALMYLKKFDDERNI